MHVRSCKYHAFIRTHTCKRAQSQPSTHWASAGNSPPAYPAVAAPLPCQQQTETRASVQEGEKNRTPYIQVRGARVNLRVVKPWSQLGTGLGSRGSCVLWNHSRLWACRDGVWASRGPVGFSTWDGAIRFRSWETHTHHLFSHTRIFLVFNS